MLVAESDLLGNFNAMTVVRAREFERARNVLSATAGEEGWYIGRVRGEFGVTYDQVISLHPNGAGVAVNGECTCPEGFNCRHVAAVLLNLSRRKELQIGDPASIKKRESAPTSAQLEGWLADLAVAAEPRNDFEADVAQRLLYVIVPKAAADGRHPIVRLMSARLLKTGEWSNVNKFSLQSIQTGQYAKYVRPIDKPLLRDLYYTLKHEKDGDSALKLAGPAAARFLEDMIETGRCFWIDAGPRPIELGPTRQGTPSWRTDDAGCQTFEIDGGSAIALPLSPPWYFDPETRLCGPMQTGLPDDLAEGLLLGPSIYPEHSARARSALEKLLKRALPEQDVALPEVREKPRVLDEPLVLHLVVEREPVQSTFGTGASRNLAMPFARLNFRYGPAVASGRSSEVRASTPDGPVVIQRDTEGEHAALEKLTKLGWNLAANLQGIVVPPERRGDLVPVYSGFSLVQEEIDQRYFRFVHRVVPLLREQGWTVDLSGEGEVLQAFEAPIVLRAVDKGTDWFDLDLGVVVDDQRIDLRPLLIKALDAAIRLKAEEADEELYYRTPEGRIVTIPLSRLRPVLKSLMELFGRPTNWPEELRVAKPRIAEMTALDEVSGLSLDLPKRLRQLADAFVAKDRMAPAFPPEGFCGQLRAYQGEGVSWLRFLADFGLGGVLADDMGLGKTVQTLGHIVSEKSQGRLDLPALIVAPTSTIPNWQAETERFAPSLKLLTLHGPKRKEDFSAIPRHDVVLTSYPLLARDHDELGRHEYHLAVLDEAQNIKNPTTIAAKAACEIRARHRVALSGTPVENRLEELWSIFRFALPGLLGGYSDFKREFGTPVEKLADKQAQQRLSRRVRPFVLRRRKEQVALELPPKTIIVDRVELEGDQRDLYESVRLAMDSRVRSLVSSKGLEKSRLEVLEALLKLRQVCCDPRLVKLPAAADVKASAKLDRLLEMVDELVAEGRRALVFSQFTSMLDLIEPQLRKQGHTWVRISGDTDDRKTPVQRFQAGEVPLFLISLRAGGTGLNLTAADTVIHYDPWWNPAVENQATDRAHRIGQDKPVFVYKLVATGTVEEKILELQQRKADLAENLLSGAADSLAALSADDLNWILSA